MYEFEAAYCYGPTERYSTGRGLSALSDDLPHLETVFAAMKREREPHALRIRSLPTGEIVREHGSIEAAHRSMMAAWLRRAAHG